MQTADLQDPELPAAPRLVIDPGMHTANINTLAADAGGRFVVTGSQDKTVRVWSAVDGQLLRTIRLPAAEGHVGEVYAVAVDPAGTLIAAGGWTRSNRGEPRQQIYLFDLASGKMVQRIGGLPVTVLALAFSPDGRRLAATLNGAHGLRVFGSDQAWSQIAQDPAYGASSYGSAFAADGRLATTSLEGMVRLYAADLSGDVEPAARVAMPAGALPFGIAFSPDGETLAVGQAERSGVDLLEATTLASRPGPNLAGVDNGDLSQVAWSADGRVLLAAGSYIENESRVVLSWDQGGCGARNLFSAACRDTVNGLAPLSSGDFMLASAEPRLVRLAPDGAARWTRTAAIADFRDQAAMPALSHDGGVAVFGLEQYGRLQGRFDIAALATSPLVPLTMGPTPDATTFGPRAGGLAITTDPGGMRASLAGHLLSLEPNEIARCRVISADASRFLLGTDFRLIAFDNAGTLMWSAPTSGVAWGANISGDGRLAVSAEGDGSLRWRRMSDGVELLAVTPLRTPGNWVAWTPEGFYASSAGARGVLRWHVNRGWDEAADSIAIEEVKGALRADALARVATEMETPRALGLAELDRQALRVRVRADSRFPANARLHLLAIGISQYNPDKAAHLQLSFADADADSFARKLLTTQASLYADVLPLVLLNADAALLGIRQALITTRVNVEKGLGDDVCIFFFSGHGALTDDGLFLLPYDVDASSNETIGVSALSIAVLKAELNKIAAHGRVLVLLDACHSGALTATGDSIPLNASFMSSLLTAENISVISSSSGPQTSIELPELGHGVFTQALLDAIPAADEDSDGLISGSELFRYVDASVRSRTDKKQTPKLDLRDDRALFTAVI